MPSTREDNRVKLHREVQKTHVTLPTPSDGEFVIVIVKESRYNRYPIKPTDLMVLTIDQNCTMGDLQEVDYEKTGRHHIFRDGRDYFKKETKIKAADYFNDGVIALVSYPDLSDRGMIPSNMICPAISEGQCASLPLNQEEKDEVLFSKAGLSDCMDRLHEKHPDDRFEAFTSKGARYFQCHDCLTRVLRPNISIKAMAKHLEDEDHQTLVEARLIRESAAPGATKHRRMMVFEPSFQKLLAQIYEAYPDDLILPGWELEFECNSVCSHDHTSNMLRPSGLNIRCLECPESARGELKEWDLEGLEERSDEPGDKEWRKFLKHLETVRHRQYVNGRLERIAELGH